MKFEDKPNREWLLRYVLGELSEAEMRIADAQFFSDDTFASTLDEMYRDLLDAYSAGEIAGSEKERAERAFFAERYQGHQLKILQAIQWLPKKVTKAAARVSGNWFPSLWPVAVSAGVLSFAIAIVLYQHNEKLPALANRNAPADATVFVETPQTLTTGPAAQAPTENVYAILLLPDVSRGNKAGKSFPIPSSAQKITFQIVLPENQTGGSFDVRLKGDKERDTHLFSGLKPREVGTQRYLEFRVPSSEVPADDYAVCVFDSAAPERPAEHFAVHVTRATSRHQ